MALNLTGPISIGGATAGQSINLELGQSASATASLNDTNVRTLAGVASGAITMPTNFYGKSNAVPTGLFYSGYTISCQCVNKVTRINSCGTLIGAETNVGSIRSRMGGATAGTTAVMYGGSDQRCCGCAPTNITTRINVSGTLVGSETAVDVARYNQGAATIGANHVSWGGYVASNPVATVVRINSSGAQVGTTTTVSAGASGIACHAGTAVGTNGLYYAGSRSTITSNVVTRINACGTLFGSTTTAGTARYALAGATIGGNGVFYGGSVGITFQTLVTRINACGALVGSQTNVTVGTRYFNGAAVSSVGVYYAGQVCGVPVIVNTTTRINSCGTQVGAKTNIGTARQYPSSASL